MTARNKRKTATAISVMYKAFKPGLMQNCDQEKQGWCKSNAYFYQQRTTRIYRRTRGAEGLPERRRAHASVF